MGGKEITGEQAAEMVAEKLSDAVSIEVTEDAAPCGGKQITITYRNQGDEVRPVPPEHQAILDQFVEMARSCHDVECAQRHAAAYRQQYAHALGQNEYHRRYLEDVVQGAVRAFDARAEELSES
jgi:hypothetical protein